MCGWRKNGQRKKDSKTESMGWQEIGKLRKKEDSRESRQLREVENAGVERMNGALKGKRVGGGKGQWGPYCAVVRMGHDPKTCY